MADRRTSFIFPPDAARKLAAIRRLSYLSTDASLLKAALSAYESILSLWSSGWRFFVRDKKGGEWPYSPYARLVYPGIAEQLVAINEAAASERIAKSKTFFFSGEAVKKIDSIKNASFVTSNADVVRLCLSAYEELLAVAAAGDELFARSRLGEEQVFNPHSPFVPGVGVIAPNERVEGLAARDEVNQPAAAKRATARA
jgi:hypothetical protein